MKRLRKLCYVLVAVVLVLGTPALAYAQAYSAGGFNANRGSLTNNSCRSDALTLNQRLLEVRQLINQIMTCNQNGQVFDSSAENCVTPTLSPDHQFMPEDTGATLAFQNVNDNGFDIAAVLGGAKGADIQCDPDDDPDDPLTCHSPWGDLMEEGDTVRAYRTASVPHGDSCDSEIRRCVGGVLTGSYTQRSCVVGDPEDDPDDCNLPWGGTIAHGDSVTAYESASVASTETCNDERRTCNDGTLSGSFTNQNCTVRDPVTTCADWQWDFDGWCRSRPGGGSIPQCNNFNILDRACNGNPNCTLRNVNYVVNTCAVCNVEAERCFTR